MSPTPLGLHPFVAHWTHLITTHKRLYIYISLYTILNILMDKVPSRALKRHAFQNRPYPTLKAHLILLTKNKGKVSIKSREYNIYWGFDGNFVVVG